MKNRKFKGTALLMALMLATTGLYGCGSKDTASNDEKNVASNDEKDVTSNGEKDVTSNGEEVVISIGNFFPSEEAQPEQYEKVMKQIEEFESTHPNVKVEDPHYFFDASTYMAMAEAGTLPTCYQLPLTEGEKVKEMGYVADLTEEFDKRGYTQYLTEVGKNNISRDGKIYYMPDWNTYCAILVNLDVYKEAGFVSEDGTLYQPTDWEDLARVAKEIKDRTGVPGFLFPSIDNQGGWRTTTMAWSYGVDFMEQGEDGKWKATFNTPEYAEMFKLISKMRWEDDSLPASTMYDYNKPQEALAAGDVGMIFGDYDYANWILTNYKMDKSKLGALGVPAGPERRVSMMSGGYRAIDRNATPEQISACIDFLEFIGMGPILNDTVKDNMDISMENDLASDKLIGLDFLSFWNEDAPAVKYKKELVEKNMNVDPKQIENYNDISSLEFQAEEPIDAQALYTLIDSMIQEVLNNKDANIEELISDAESTFQTNNLDFAE